MFWQGVLVGSVKQYERLSLTSGMSDFHVYKLSWYPNFCVSSRTPYARNTAAAPVMVVELEREKMDSDGDLNAESGGRRWRRRRMR
ncbi:hypothetical protein E2C01_059495 [Portunus trituberculatus]|uniref:Uncharacterized protein n=1 Tax=Portunus trituberculatus TaxID=210409 RepID=A0A5B7GYC3_PORTR|nr:hypothetical protein [Portunus trituberculatus]